MEQNHEELVKFACLNICDILDCHMWHNWPSPPQELFIPTSSIDSVHSVLKEAPEAPGQGGTVIEKKGTGVDFLFHQISMD